MPHSLRFMVVLLAIAALCAPVSLFVQHWQSVRQSRHTASALTGGDPERGLHAMERYGCGACHEIDGVPGATGRVGPSLKGLTRRAELAGKLGNDPASLVRWIQHPQAVQPGVGMPELNVGDGDARDIAAYIYAS